MLIDVADLFFCEESLLCFATVTIHQKSTTLADPWYCILEKRCTLDWYLDHVVKSEMNSAGPVTILNWSFPRKDITRQAQAFQLALAIREEVADLEKAGCRVIQVLVHPHSFTLIGIKLD